MKRIALFSGYALLESGGMMFFFFLYRLDLSLVLLIFITFLLCGAGLWGYGSFSRSSSERTFGFIAFFLGSAALGILPPYLATHWPPSFHDLLTLVTFPMGIVGLVGAFIFAHHTKPLCASHSRHHH